MPIHIASSYLSGLFALDALPTLLACVVAITFLKRWSGGVDLIRHLDQVTARPPSKLPNGTRDGRIRDLHGTVIVVVGGFTSQGLLTCTQLSTLGAQLILLTPSIASERIVQLVHLLRDGTSNPLIYAEECDVTSISSVEAFAAQWNLGDGAERLMSGPSTEYTGGLGAGLQAKTKKNDKEGANVGVAPRRVDSIIFLPLDEARQSVGGTVRSTTESLEYSQAEIVGRFHLVNLLLPSLLLLPPSRDIRIVSLLSPWYAAGLHSFNIDDGRPQEGKKSKRATSSASVSPWSQDGHQALLWLSLSRELQRRIQLMTEADQRPRTRLPGIDDEGNVTGKALSANVNLINVCAGFERGRDVLDYVLPQTQSVSYENASESSTDGQKAQKEGKGSAESNVSASTNQLKDLVDPRLKQRVKPKAKEAAVDEEADRIRKRFQEFYPSHQAPPPIQRLLNVLRYAITALLWPLAWLLCKSPRRVAETVTWAVLAPIYPNEMFDPAMNGYAVVPGELHREGRIIRPPLPDALLPGEPADVLWKTMEEKAKRALSHSSTQSFPQK